MKILKNCFCVFLSILIFILLSVVLTLNSLISVAFSPKVINNFIDNLDIRKIGYQIADNVTEDFENNPEGSKNSENGGQEEFDVDELNNYAKDIVDSLSDQDIKVIKDTSKSSITELFNFMKHRDKKELVFNIKDARRLLIKILINTPDFEKNISLPKPICKGDVQTNCITEENMVVLFEKAFTGSLTLDDIDQNIGICKGSSSPKGCMSQKEADKLVKDISKNRSSANVLFENPDGSIVIGQDKLTESKSLDGVRSVTSRLNLIFLCLFSIILLFYLVIFLIKRSKAMNWITLINVFIIILQLALVIALNIGFSKLENKYLVDLKMNSVDVNEYVRTVAESYVSALERAFIARILIISGITMVLIIGPRLIKLINEKKNKPIIT